MPIVIGLGDENAWNDPLNVYGGKPAQSEATKPTISGRDYEDVVNTVIAEAAGEGDDGMAAVASVIRNRADKRGKSLADIVREPKQFTGYEAPGPDAVKAMQDPQMRARAASIVDRVLAGELPDVTGGADHYHADYVQPDWASKMPQTAKVGRHIFYRDGERGGQKASAYAPGLDVGTASDPFAAVLRGDAGRQVLSPLKDQPAGNDVLLSKLQPGKPASYIADLHDDMRAGLTTMFTEAPDFVREGLDILSGARTPEKQAQIIADNAGKYGFSRRAWEADVEAMGPVEAGKKWRPMFRELGVTKNIGMPGGSNHQHGTATDLGWKGGPFSSAPKEVRDWVHTNAGNYGLAFPMAHEPWHIETANARAGGNAKQAQGKTIVVDGAFKTSDPMGLMAGGNPFEAIASQQQAATDQTEADTADGFERSRIAAENERHNAEVQKAAAADPSRYELVDEAAAQDWQKTWNAENQSSGRAGDFVRNFGIGAAQTSQSISNLNELLISKLPGGDWINEKLNSIERWMGGGKTVAEARKESIERQAASRSEEGKAAAEKTVFQKDSWALGDALSDPDWYLMQIAQSAPSTIATMAPSGLLARGAFTAAMASGAGEVAAAGAAAKMATVAGGVTEGILGGAQSALSIKEKIAAIPRDQLLQSDAVKQLIADGKTEDEAIRAVSDDAQVQGLVTAGVATGIFGGMGDRAMAQIIGEGIGGGIARRVATGAVKGAVGEGVFEEMPQNVAQTVAENAAMRGVKPDQQLFEGGAEAAASGLAAGAAMGGGMGAVGGAMSPRAPGASDATDAPDTEPPMPATQEPKGPVGRAVQHAEQQIAARAAPAPGAEQGSALPEVGATVRVDADGIAPFMGQIEGYEGSEAVVIDNGSGEVYQIPIENLTRIAPAIGQAATPDAGPQPINDSIPEYSSDPALEPMQPRGTDIQTEPLPPASEQKPATERFPSAPLPGERVIVDDPNGGRFPAKVRSYEEGATEALVVTDDGKELQVPVASLAVSKLTDKQVEAQELKRNPPVDRTEERAAAGPNSRAVSGRTVVMPDDRHARLYDLGRDRTLTKRTLGASQLDLGGVNNPELQALATEFKVTPQAIEAMADDYRYRVERAAKSATSDMPQRVAPVNERRLMQWQREAAKAAPESHAQEQTAGMWWDAELTEMDRKRILAEAGVKRSEKMMWAGFTPGIRAKLEPFRVKQVDEPNDQVDGMSASVGDNASAVDTAAHKAATSPSNDMPEPTQAQKEAGNYKLGHLRIGGLDISVENPAGSERKGVDPSGKPWSVEMKSHYGYIKGTVGKDKDHIDVFLRPGTETLSDDSPVFVVDQQSEKGSFDEHKVMLGFESEEAAKAAYLENYTAGWNGLRSITPTTLGAFKQWTAQGDTTKPFAPKAPPTADPYDEVHRRMGVRVSPKDFVSDVANKKLQTAAVIDTRGKLWVLKPTTNPAGDHAEFFGELIGRDLVPFDKTGYVTVTSYSGQIGATSDGPMSVAQSSTVNAIRSAAERYGVNYTGEQPDAAAGTAVRVDNDRAASAEPAEQNRTDAEEAQNGPSDVAEKRRRAGAGSPVASGRKDVAPATRNADTNTALTPAFDASKYPWNDVWGSEAEVISDALSRLSSTNGGDQPLVDLIRSGASDAELLNFIGTRWGIGGAGGNRYMVETSAGPTVTVILEKDDGKKRVVLKGPKLARALREEFNVSLDEMRAKAEGEQEKPKAKPEVSENKIFTSDAAERARALLRSKFEIKPGNILRNEVDTEAGSFSIAGTPTVTEVLQATLDSANEIEKDLAEKVISFVGNVKVRFVNREAMSRIAPGAAGAFDTSAAPDSVMITILNDRSKSAVRRIALHEAIHAMTVQRIKQNRWAMSLRSIQQAISDHLRDNPVTSPRLSAIIKNALQSEEEVLSYGMTDPEFQRFLNSVTLSKQQWEDISGETAGPRRSAWFGLVSMVRRILNLPKNTHSALEATIRVTEAMSQTPTLSAASVRPQIFRSDIDPEMMQAGITLAGYHIERGARTFAAYAGAMLADLGEVARPYLKSWYMGVKYDPRATAFDGMSSAAEVDAADVNAIGGNDEPAELEDDGAGALEAEPAGTIPPVEGGRKAGSRTGSGGGADIPRGDTARGERGEPRRRVADDEGAVSPSASKPGASGSSKPDATGPRRDARRAEDNAGEVGPFGPILRGYEGRWRDAALELERLQTGDAIGALHHKDVGPIDLVWGKAGNDRSDGFGLAKLIAWHPEVLVDLQGTLDAMEVVSRSDNRIQLQNPGKSKAGVRLSWDGKTKHWLISAFVMGERRSERSTDRLANIWADASSAPPPIENITDKLKNVQSAAVPAQKQAADFAISADDKIGQGGAKTKFANNVAAIRLLRTLTDEQRPATRDEQATLAKWVGWGGLREAFGRDDGSVSKGWEKQAAELRDLLTPEEYRAAEASTRNAHYTAPEVASAMWSIAQRLGFRGGQVLEPSVGVGNFIGLMPGDVRSGSRVTGVELDHITGGIAKHLYPGANIQAPVGFETFSMPDGYFDLAIGNPPFGSERLYDKGRPHLRKMAIHNFFFAKSIEGLKPGGVLAMVVTNRFLDNGSMVTRQLISKQADLIGAIRLPNTAFLKNAGTEVTTDIVLFQKRAPGTEPASNAWLETVDYRGADGKPVPLNRYFIDNPQMMLGEFGAYGTMYGPDEPALIAPKGQDLPAELEKAINRLPSGIMSAPGAKPVIAEKVAEGVEDVHVGSLFLADGQVHQRMPDSLGQPQSKPVEFPNEKAKERVSGMVRVRDVFARLRRAQIDENASEKQVENLRAMLNKAYDAFVSKHGPINADGNKRLFRDDPTWPQISALENNFDKGISDAVAKTTGEKARAPSAEKAPIFRKRTQEPYHPPIHAETAKDALAQTLNERGRVDMKYMQSLYGKGEEDITSELGPLLFKTPSGAHEVADAYLSGNVKAKLAEAERAAETDPDFRRNIAALRDVIPADIEPVDIDVKPGAPWVPGKHVADFINHITESRGATAHYSKMQGAWALDIPHAAATAETLWGTGRASVGQIVTAALNGKSAQVFNRDANGNAVIDQAATDAANEKVERVKTEWQRWLWDNDARRDELARLYNDTFNTDVVRVYDGEHLTLPGKVSDDIITLRPHQKSFVWRTLQSSVALADHTVGAGKTFALIASVMEKRRTGQAKKPLLTVPNHLVGQWAADFVKLYPGAKVLAATKRDFERENRKRLMARITTGDWDAVIIAHSQFGLIGVAPESEAKFIEQQIVDMEASIRDMRQQTGEKSRNVNQLAKQRQNLETKLKTLLDAGRKDDGLYFDDLGVDALYVDEFHEFKNLPFVTGMQRVAGLGNPAGSKKATDMYLKIQQVIERTGGNIVVATGTPLSNTMAEMYTLQRYLSPKVLTRLGIAHFDAWARVFGDVVTDWELSPSGQYKLNTRFARFVNIPELMTQYLSFADVISNDDIKAQLAAQGKTLPLPKIKGGKPTNITVERSPDQASYIGEGSMGADGSLSFPAGSLVYRAENLPKKAEKGADNMLKVMSDARKAALDMRLIDPGYGDYSGSKVNRAADEMKRIYDEWGAEKGAQLVFIDLSTPKKAKAKEEAALRALIKRADDGDEAAQEKLDAMSPDEFLALESPFSVYDDLRDKLIERGVPAAEIAFIHDANTELQKEELFGKVRSGRIRFLFGSTAKMGAGTNVQNRLVALHHLDAPWRPSDLEQRDGRIVRQGNELYAADPTGFEVEILRYATKNTLDARQWQGIEAKARFIGQIRKGDVKTRVIEDIAGEAANAAEMKAAASGNPLILEEMDTRRRLRQLEAQATEHEREQHRIKAKMRDVDAERTLIEGRADAVAVDAASAAALAAKPFSAVVAGETVEKPKEFGAALLAAMRNAIVDGTENQKIGSYGDFQLSIEHNYQSNFTVIIDGAREHNVTVSDAGEQDATGLAMQIINTVKRLQNVPVLDSERAAELTKQAPALEKQLGPWAGVQELSDTAAKHRRLIDALKPKAKPAAGVAPATGTTDTPDMLPSNKDKRPDPLMTGTGNNFRSLKAPPVQPGQSLLDWATKAVLAKGRADGNEYLVAVEDDGSLIEHGTTSDRRNVGLSLKLERAMLNPDRQIAIFHNHPANGPISRQDMTQLAYPGVYSVWALGHDGKNTRVSLAAGARDALGLKNAEPATVIAKMSDLARALTIAEGKLRDGIQNLVNDRVITGDQASTAHLESMPLVAARAGVIDYQTNEPYDVGQVPGLDGLIDDAALILSGALFNERNAKKIADARVRGPAKSVRHIAELERLAGGYQQVAAQQSGSSALHEGSAGDYSAKAAGTVTRERITRELSGRLTDIQPALLKAIPLNYFTELARPNMKAVGDYLRVKRLMDAFRGEKHAAADEVAGDWIKYARLGLLGKDKTRAQALSDLMHQSTIYGIDPSQTDEETTQKFYYEVLRKKYMALSPAGRALYQRVRDAYKAQAEELDQILLDNVRKAQQIAQDRAADRYKRTLQKIRDAGLSPLDRRRAEEDAESAYKAEKTKSTWAAKARMTKMRIAFESTRVQPPYFPLGRFGRYFVTLRNADGSVASFSKFEKAADRDRFADEVAAQYADFKIEKGVMEQGSDLRRAMDPRMVAEIETMLGDAGVGNDVMDMIWQRYLETMPDLSTRKRFIHRKGTAGYDKDALRVFSSHMFHAAHQMAKVKFGLELQELVNQTTEQAKEADDQTRAMTLANELSKRHDWVMNPTGSKVAQTMTSAAFVWFMAASPASAAVNMAQTYMMGVPILGAKFGGALNAARALVATSYVKDADLKSDEQSALDAFMSSGLIDRTQSHDLAGVGETGVDYTPLRARIMGVLSWAFHKAEVWNRRTVALAAYRLAREAGQDYLTAVDTAHELTWKTHFDYSNSSRPALMQNDFAKVALVFRQYNINMLYRVFRDVQQSIAGESAQAKREARFQLAGVIGMMTLVGGLTGTFGFNLAMTLAGMVFGDDDDPIDFAEGFKADVVNILGPELGGILLNGAPGHYLGIDLSSRIGMPDLWWRSPAQELQGKDEYMYWVSQSLGATVSLGEQLFRGAELISEGDVARGVEILAPKFVRDLMKSYRYANEGLTTIRGDEMMTPERIGWHGVVAQALGFTPAAVSETWERNSAMKNAETKLMDERQRLVNKWAMAAMDGDKAGVEEATKAISKWNAVPIHQPVAIKKETLQRSIKTRAANDAKRQDGTLIKNEILGRRLRDAMAERVY